MTDGKVFLIIVKVAERKPEKQKCVSLNQSILSKIQNCFSEKELCHFSFYHGMNRENTHAGFHTLGKINEL